MEKDFLPYEEAYQLMNLGYNEPCLKYTPILMADVHDPPFGSDWYVLEKKLGLPLFSEAFRWFREKHQLPSWVYTSNNQEYWYSVLTDGRMIVRDYNPFKSHEHAELSCLRKLIQIVKEKQ